jgi:hypothetical protein
MSDFNYEDLGEATYEPVQRPARRDFEVWHRPRKQVVRQRQWIHETAELLRRNERPVLKYFGLPGIDMLDLRALYLGLCVPNHVKLEFLGLAREAKPGTGEHMIKEVTLQQLKQLDLVTPKSDVLAESLESLGSVNHVLFKTAQSFGPFDLINLDLCDGLLDKSPNSAQPNLYSALHQLMTIQGAMTLPWVFCLTTRISTESIHADTVDLLLSALRSSECDDLLVQFEDRIGIPLETFEPATAKPETFAVFVTLALCAWLSKLAQTRTPHRITVRPMFAYRVLADAPEHDMLSVAIKFTPIAGATAPDDFGIARGDHVPEIAYCASLVRTLQLAYERTDVDVLLGADSPLRSAMIEESADLLEWARFDVVEYKAWVDKFAS